MLLTRQSHYFIVEGFLAGAAVRCVSMKDEWHYNLGIFCLLLTARSKAAEKINDGRKQSSP